MQLNLPGFKNRDCKLLLYFSLFAAILSFSQNGNPRLNYIAEKVRMGTTFDSASHFILFYPNGKKKLEYFHRNGSYIDTLKLWNSRGEIYHTKMYSDTGYIETERSVTFLETESLRNRNCVQKVTFIQLIETGAYKKFDKPPQVRTIDDSTSWTRYTVYEHEYQRPPYYLREGVWRVFYENGVLKACGRYLPELYGFSRPDESEVIIDGFEPHNWRFKDGTRFSGFYPGSACYLKDGEWIYFDETGEEKSREYYRDGILRSKK